MGNSDKNQPTIKAAWITGLLGCSGVTLAAIIALLLPLAVRVFDRLLPSQEVPRVEAISDIRTSTPNFEEGKNKISPSPSNDIFPTSTPEPILVESLAIQANIELGELFTVPSSGWYQISNSLGSYSTGPVSLGGKQWRTAIYIYPHASQINWGGKWNEPIEPLFIIGCRADQQPTTEAVEESCAGNAGKIRSYLTTGEEYTFISVDEKSSYSDNVGTVIVDVFQLSGDK